jgi:hypothetical protein
MVVKDGYDAANLFVLKPQHQSKRREPEPGSDPQKKKR